MFQIRARRPKVAMLSPPCTWASQIQRTNVARSGQQKHAHRVSDRQGLGKAVAGQTSLSITPETWPRVTPYPRDSSCSTGRAAILTQTRTLIRLRGGAGKKLPALEGPAGTGRARGWARTHDKIFPSMPGCPGRDRSVAQYRAERMGPQGIAGAPIGRT